MNELKPCPFCGGVEIVIVTSRWGCSVDCLDCDGSIRSYKDKAEYKTLKQSEKAQKKKAVEKWNRRIEK